MAEPTTLSVIPPSLLSHLQELRPVLLKQGIVQMRQDGDRRASFRLRYRADDPDLGAERHCSLPLGTDQSIAGAVSTLISSWRDEQASEERKQQALREQEAAEAEQYRQLVAIVVKLNGGGRRMRTRALKALKEAAAAGPWELLKFGSSNDWLQPGQPGRPPKPRYR